MGDTSRPTGSGEQSAVVVSSIEDSGRPYASVELPQLELDETIPPRPEEEIADALRAERQP